MSDPLAVAHIPLPLLSGAEAVVRYDNVHVTIAKEDELYYERSVAITILGAEADHLGSMVIPYERTVDKISKITVEILDGDGKVIKKVKKKDIADQSATDGHTTASDNRVMVYSHLQNSYPYTIRYSYLRKSKNTFIPAWVPITSAKVAIQVSTYKIDNDVPHLSIKAYTQHLGDKVKTIDTAAHRYLMQNVGAIALEKMSPPAQQWLPKVSFHPSSFSFYGYVGDYVDWEGYGRWVYDQMLGDKGNLPPELIAELDKKIGTEEHKRKIASIIYDHVTNSTRYVSIQLGIGGFMPFSCSDVYNWKYGDCKALSYYTHRLLDHYGIESIYTEIQSDRDYNISYDPVRPGLDQGNHIVLCLPMEGDTVWLECTSSHSLFGHTHSGINDRRALLITKDGGRLVRTTAYTAAQNLSKTAITVDLSAAGEAKIALETAHHNQRHEAFIGMMLMPETKRKERLRSMLDNVAAVEVSQYALSLDSAQIVCYETMKLTSDSYVERAGTYQFLPLDIGRLPDLEKLPQDRIRNIYIKDSKADQHEISVSIPIGYEPLTADLEMISFANSFGTISTKVHQDGDVVTVQTSITINKGSYPFDMVGDYNAYVSKIDEIKAQKLIIKRKSN